MARKRVDVIKESESGRNQRFRDNQTSAKMTRAEFVRAIEQDKYPKYHVRKINNIKTPVSNPDKTTDNNLG